MFLPRIVGLRAGEVVFDGPPAGLTADVLTDHLRRRGLDQDARRGRRRSMTRRPTCVADTERADRRRRRMSMTGRRTGYPRHWRRPPLIADARLRWALVYGVRSLYLVARRSARSR